MASKLGENMQREWDNEPLAGELWDALQARKTDRYGGNAMLADLAARGSTLAMMYLGHAYVKEGSHAQTAEGEDLLRRSAQAGSIEGRFQLACHYERQGTFEKARAELEVLVGKGYLPAMYCLGRLYYRGDLGTRAIPEAIAYLKMAIDLGHLPSMGLLSWIYRREQFGIGGKVAGHWLCLTKIPAVIRCMWRYPNSDKLRPYGHYSNA